MTGSPGIFDINEFKLSQQYKDNITNAENQIDAFIANLNTQNINNDSRIVNLKNTLKSFEGKRNRLETLQLQFFLKLGESHACCLK